MEGILVLSVWVVFCLSLVYYKVYYHPAIIFNGLWAVILSLYSMHLFGLYHASDENLFVIFNGILAVNLGCLLHKVFRDIAFSPMSFNSIRYTAPSLRLIKILSLISISILSYGAYTNLRRLPLYTASYMRYNGMLYEEPTYTILRDFVAVPVFFAVMCIAFSFFVHGGNFQNLLRYVLAMALLEILALFEQIGIYTFASCMLVSIIYFIYEKKNISPLYYKKVKRRITYTVSLGIAMLFILISFRPMNIIEHLYTYTTGSITFFSIRFDEFCTMSRDSFIGQYTYGFASFQGIIRPLMGVLERIGIESDIYDSASVFYTTYMAQPRFILPGHYYNSFSTMFVYFYKDFGYPGIYILSMLFGYVMSAIYYEYRKRKTVMSLAMYFYLCMGIFFSYIQSPFTDKKYAFAIIILLAVSNVVKRLRIKFG